jgi:hypothetical protein
MSQTTNVAAGSVLHRADDRRRSGVLRLSVVRSILSLMSMPSVPGYLEPPAGDTLAALWERPAGSFPNELWPVEDLRAITSSPSGWLIVEEHFHTDAKHGGRGCVLVEPGRSPAALEDASWIGGGLGKVSIWNDNRFDNGLSDRERDVSVEFFVQARHASGAPLPVPEISHPFLWYWEAFPTNTGWKYLNRAGREQDLARWELSELRWKIEVRALEFRQFLAAYGRDAVVEVDFVPKANSPEFERVENEFRNEWAYFDFYAMHDLSMGDGRPAFSRLLGKYLITGLRNSRVPRFEERKQEREYPTFIYGLDQETGQPLTHTCDPKQLGTYFDKDNSRLHYLTPIYFKREVLQPYAAESARYHLSTSRLTCLDLWGLSISFNSAGLVEVYLGDLGRDLPSDEWGHWRTYNVPPEGEMDEGRFRRDFLNQWASSKNLVGDLRRARQTAAETSEKLLGAPIWKPLPTEIRAEFDSLIGPLSDDPASLGAPLLLLTKVLIDGIDPAPLKAHLQCSEKGDQSIRLLQKYTQQLGGTYDTTAVLRELQSFRSKGGLAHLAGSQVGKAKAALEISGLSNLEAFESVVSRATACINSVTELIEQELQTETVVAAPVEDGPHPAARPVSRAQDTPWDQSQSWLDTR